MQRQDVALEQVSELDKKLEERRQDNRCGDVEGLGEENKDIQVLVIQNEPLEEVENSCEGLHADCDLEVLDEHENKYPLWMRRSLDRQELAVVDAMRSQERSVVDFEITYPCDECNKRATVFDCAECALSLCFMCTDAIHIIEAFATHTITPTQVSAQTSHVKISDDPQSSSLDPKSPAQTKVVLGDPPSRFLDPPTLIEHRLHLPIGTKLFFRAVDCGRWSRELLHSSVVGLDHGVRSNEATHEPNLTFYYRVVWLRGVEALANGFFRAALVLPRPFWPVEIGLFPSQLSAFRAVLTAERLARAMLRRERISGRWHETPPHNDVNLQTRFPTVDIVNEILNETETILGHEFRTRITQQDDAAFLQALSTGSWEYGQWMKRIGRENDLREEAAAIDEVDDALRTIPRHENAESPLSLAAELLLLWSPRDHMRFFLLEQRELLLPERVQRAHVASIVHQMLFVYVGFAWQRWLKFVKRHRRHELKQRRNAAAQRLITWWRHQSERERQRKLHALRTSPLDALTLYRQRQIQAVKLYEFMLKQYEEKQRRALHHLAHATIDTDESRDKRAQQETAMAAAARGTWHPSHGITSLPRLPRMYAHRKPDGSVGIDDLGRYKQFRANHAGPTESSYWVIRHRVLMGVYPAGIPAFRDARRIVSRADYTTSILLEQIGTFVCLLEPSELEQHEPMIDASCLVQFQQQKKSQVDTPPTTWQTPWLFERIVRAKHALLRTELASAVQVTERFVHLAQRELDDVDLSPAPIDRETFANKLALAQQNARKARETLAQLALLDFVLFPMPQDHVPADVRAFDAFLINLEDRLRRQERLYIFSLHGHGRTGLVAALLLGRLYGLTATDALGRAQRLHDCQYRYTMPNAPRLVSSPHAVSQVTMVTHLLAQTNDAIYARVERGNRKAAFIQWRYQQRGQPLDPSMAKREGFLVTDPVDEATQAAQQREHETLRRVATRESAATRLQWARRREQREREAMLEEDTR